MSDLQLSQPKNTIVDRGRLNSRALRSSELRFGPFERQPGNPIEFETAIWVHMLPDQRRQGSRVGRRIRELCLRGRKTVISESEPTLGSPDRGIVEGYRTMAPVCARPRHPVIFEDARIDRLPVWRGWCEPTLPSGLRASARPVAG